MFLNVLALMEDENIGTESGCSVEPETSQYRHSAGSATIPSKIAYSSLRVGSLGYPAYCGSITAIHPISTKTSWGS